MVNGPASDNISTKLLDIRGLSAYTGVSLSTLNRLKANGKLPHHRIGGRIVFTPEDISAFLDLCKVSAASEGGK